MNNYVGALIKLQTAKGSPATLTAAANSMLMVDPQLTPYAGDEVKSNAIKAHMGGNKSVRVGEHSTLTFSVEINGSGTADTPPAFGDLLVASGHNETIDSSAGNESVVYSMVPTLSLDNTKYVSIEFYEDGQKKRINNARGTLTSISVNEKNFIVASFEFIGDYASYQTSASMPTFNYSQFKMPIPVSKANTPIAKFFNRDIVLASFTLNPNLSQSYINRPNKQGPEYDGGSREVNWDMQFEAFDLSDFDVFAKWESHDGQVETGTAKIQHGTTAGQIVIIDIAESQINSVDASDNSGRIEHSVKCTAIAVSDAQEYQITFK